MPQAGALTAARLLELLALKHHSDVFIPECKDGPTLGAHPRRLDAWALRSSWGPLTTLGYEIKCTRGDFAGDQKWTGYLPLCHEFYIVCPSGLVRSAELPVGVGLIWATANGARLHTKLRATRREPDAAQLVYLMAYALMWRTRVVAEGAVGRHEEPAPLDRMAVYQRHVEDTRERGEVAVFIRGYVREVHKDARDRAFRAAAAMQMARVFAARLERLGVRWDPMINDWRVRCGAEREIDLLYRGIDDHALGDLECGARRLLEGIAGVRAARAAAEVRQ